MHEMLKFDELMTEDPQNEVSSCEAKTLAVRMNTKMLNAPLPFSQKLIKEMTK